MFIQSLIVNETQSSTTAAFTDLVEPVFERVILSAKQEFDQNYKQIKLNELILKDKFELEEYNLKNPKKKS